VVVVEFAGALGARLHREFYFADERASPGLVDPGAEFALHAFELLLPGFGVGGDFEAAIFAADGTRARGEDFADDRWPRAGKPGECGFGAVEAAQGASEEISGAFHEFADSSTESENKIQWNLEGCRQTPRRTSLRSVAIRAKRDPSARPPWRTRSGCPSSSDWQFERGKRIVARGGLREA